MDTPSETTLNEARGGVIKSAAIKEECVWLFKSASAKGPGFRMEFEDGRTLLIYDSERKCCEARNMSSDDNLADMLGATFLGFVPREYQEGPSDDAREETFHDQQFLDLRTNKGVFTLVAHNEHNGFYWGIEPQLRWEAENALIGPSE